MWRHFMFVSLTPAQKLNNDLQFKFITSAQLLQNCSYVYIFNKLLVASTTFERADGRSKMLKPLRLLSLSNMIITALCLSDAEQFNTLFKSL
jgi:hypothetical protein